MASRSDDAHDTIIDSGIRQRIDIAPTSPGPLDGVRVGVKELIAIAGVETTTNSSVELAPDRRWPAADSTVVALLRSAGARITATTVTHELAWGITTYGEGDRVVNPMRADRVAGGSSGGSAVAVATGRVDLGVGTDTAGSVRIPAAWCGCWGWKAGAGVVDNAGVLPLAPPLDHVGLIARDRLTLVAGATALGAHGHDVLRIVVPKTAEADRNSRSAQRIAISQLADAGWDVVAVAWPEPEGLLALFEIVQGTAALRAHRDTLGTWPSQAARYPTLVAERLRRAEQIPDSEVVEARRRHAEMTEEVRQLLRHAVAVVPTTGCDAPAVTTPDSALVDGRLRDLRRTVLPHTVVANLCGLPALALPIRGPKGITSVQLIGGVANDLGILDIAQHVASP